MSVDQELDKSSSGLMLIKGDGGWAGSIVFAAIWNLFAWPFAYTFIMHSGFGWPVHLFVSIFPLLGLVFVFVVLKAFLQNRRMGKPHLALLSPGIPGKEPLQAKIQFNPPLAQRIATAEILYPVRVRLVCARVDSRSEDTRVTEIWEHVALQANYPRGTKELAFSVDLPVFLPAAEMPVSKLVKEYWLVVLEALGATVKFKVPVNAENIARISEIPDMHGGDRNHHDGGLAETRKAAPWWVRWGVVLVFGFMVWDFAGELISPFMQSVVLKIMGQEHEIHSAKIERVHKPGKIVPIQLDSLAGNGFGVVAKVTGQIEIGEDDVIVYPESIELRSIYNCEPECPYIRSVYFSLTKDETGYFLTLSRGQKIPVAARLNDSGGQFVKLEETDSRVFLNPNKKMDLTDARLTLEIEGEVKDQTEVHQASWYTHSDSIRYLLGEKHKPVNIAWTSEGKLKQARQAVFEDRYDDLRRILEDGVDINVRDERGETMLMQAAFRGNLNIIKLLIDHKVDVNMAKPIDHQGIGGETALHIAVSRDHDDVVRLLLDAGANLDVVANQYWTPVHFAASSGAIKSMNFFHLMKKNIDEPFKGARHTTPIMLAAQFDKPEMIKALIEMGADAERKDLYGVNACGYARHFNKSKALDVLGCK